MSDIVHRTHDHRGAFIFEVSGNALAEMAYTMANDHTMIIEHTEVDESLRGQGIGKTLQAALVDYVRENNIKVIPLCPFAKSYFERMKEWQDVLVNRNESK